MPTLTSLTTKGLIGGGGGGGAATSAPTVTVVSPLVPPIVRETIIIMNITATVAMSRVFVYAVYTRPNSWEVVFDGENWGPAFVPVGLNNTRTTIANGYQFRILRNSGWQQTPSIRMIGVAGGIGP